PLAPAFCLFVACFHLFLPPVRRLFAYPSRLFSYPTRRPPQSPLFPSRRSSDLGVQGEALARRRRQIREQEVLDDLARAQLARGEDRKSTRLNSSHVSTSYAVFCLKRKKDSAAANQR